MAGRGCRQPRGRGVRRWCNNVCVAWAHFRPGNQIKLVKIHSAGYSNVGVYHLMPCDWFRKLQLDL
jgi:hypothetical protein